MVSKRDVKFANGYLNVKSLHIKVSDFNDHLSAAKLEILRDRLANMFEEVEDRFKEHGRPVRIIAMLAQDKLGVMSYDGRNARFYIVDTNKKTISTSLTYEMARLVAKHDIVYIRRAQVLNKLQQEYPGQPKELFSEVEKKLADPARAGPDGYAFEAR